MDYETGVISGFFPFTEKAGKGISISHIKYHNVAYTTPTG